MLSIRHYTLSEVPDVEELMETIEQDESTLLSCNTVLEVVRDAIDDLGCLDGYLPHTPLDSIAYGIFLNNQLIGCFTLGGADEIEEANTDDLLLSDFYILPIYRNHGYGSQVLTQISQQFPTQSVYADLWNDDSLSLYERNGFTLLDSLSGLMVKDALERETEIELM